MLSPEPADSSLSAAESHARDFGRVLLFLTLASFAISFNIRVTDPLLPSLASEFGSTPGQVAVVVVFYSVAHGLMQFLGGPLGDRYGKLRVITVTAFAAAITTAACALADSVFSLSLWRLASAGSAAAIMPLSLAWIGDSTPYQIRQATIARVVSGMMLGFVAGQAATGIIAEYLGWRPAFVLVGVLFAIPAIGLVLTHGLRNGVPKRAGNPSMAADFIAPILLLRQPEVRAVITATAAQGLIVFGATTFLGADLHDRFGLSYSQIGLVLAMFGAGGLAYTFIAPWLIARLGERGLISIGGLTFSASLAGVAATPVWAAVPFLLFVGGLALLMLHNTLQTRATQMAPDARGAALSLFAAAFFSGQLIGVAIAAKMYDRFGGPLLFAVTAILFGATVWALRSRLTASARA